MAEVCKEFMFQSRAILGREKTTVLSNLTGYLNRIPEPVYKYSSYQCRKKETFHDKKERMEVDPLLEMYKNPSLDSAMVQYFILDTGLTHYEKSLDRSHHQLNVSERSVLSPASFIAAKLDCGIISQLTASMLRDLQANIILKYKPVVPKYIIYLQTDPKTCLERIQKRTKDATVEFISEEYLNALHKQHEYAFKYSKAQFYDPYVKVINTNDKTCDQVVKEVNQFLDDIAHEDFYQEGIRRYFPKIDAQMSSDSEEGVEWQPESDVPDVKDLVTQQSVKNGEVEGRK